MKNTETTTLRPNWPPGVGLRVSTSERLGAVVDPCGESVTSVGLADDGRSEDSSGRARPYQLVDLSDQWRVHTDPCSS